VHSTRAPGTRVRRSSPSVLPCLKACKQHMMEYPDESEVEN
jgi:hypothetical protein